MHWSFQLTSSISPAWPTSGMRCSAIKPPSLSHGKRDLPSHGLPHRVICGSWSLVKRFATFFTPQLIGSGLVLCWAPRGVSAHLQKCCWLLSEHGYLLNYYGLNSGASMPFEHRTQESTLPSQCRAVLLWEGHRRGVALGSDHTSAPPVPEAGKGRSHSTFCHGAY